MTTQWSSKDTTTHQDHVIAHVAGATVLAYFILDEALHVLLDIGFIWKIYADGEMGLLPHPVAVGELEADEGLRAQIIADIDLLLQEGFGVKGLTRLKSPPVNCLIEEVTLFIKGDERQLLVTGEVESLAIYTSLTSGEIKVVGV